MTTPQKNGAGPIGPAACGFDFEINDLPIFPCVCVCKDAGGRYWLVDTVNFYPQQNIRVAYDRVELPNPVEDEWGTWQVFLSYRNADPPFNPGKKEWEECCLVLAPNVVTALQIFRQKATPRPGWQAFTMTQLPAVPVEPARCGGSVPYHGVRGKDGICRIFRAGDELSPKRSILVRAHCPAGFGWGNRGSGASQTALALLLDVTNDVKIARALVERFRDGFVQHWPDEWQLCGKDILEWIDSTKP